MGQVTIYLDEKTEAEMNLAVSASGMSKSRWVAQVIRKSTGHSWPKSIRELAGAWPDFPSTKEIRQSSEDDISRELF